MLREKEVEGLEEGMVMGIRGEFMDEGIWE